MSFLRLYDPAELGRDGYPFAWSRCPGCNGTGWRCGYSGGPADLKRGSCCDEGHPEPCPSMNGCPDCWAPGGFGGEGSIKRLVRALADQRCVRCFHPYVCGETPAEWSPCDRRCRHRGPSRLSYTADDGSYVDRHEHELATEAGVVVGYGKRVEARWRVLTVHHLDGNKANCRWWNLAALCQRCHLQIQGKVQMERVWPWEHSDWFRPYVAGYYAWTYLGEELERVEVAQRLDDLLALERAA